MNKRISRIVACIFLFLICIGCSNRTIDISVGESVESIRNQYLDFPMGKEIDLG